MSVRTRGLLATLGLILVVLTTHYGVLLRAPNHHMFSTAGDGMKNYFTFAWHVEHDTTALGFSGMNAPHGEHLNYVDGQPLFSNVWRGVDAVWPEASKYSVGLVNILIMGSVLLSAVFLFLILFRSGVDHRLAAIAAVVIALMSMQVLRGIQAHYALAYSWCLPASIWAGLQQWRSVRPWVDSMLLCLLLLAWLWIHVYLGFMACALILLWALLAAPARGERMNRPAMLVAPVLALVLFQVVMVLSDTHTDRTEHPFGFFHYHTTWTSLLTPDHMWDSPLAEHLLGIGSAEVAENWAYLGLGGLLMIGVLLIAGTCAAVVPKWRSAAGDVLPPPSSGHFTALLLAGLVLLLFSFALPFSLGLEDLFWRMPVIRQFRAPGRFAWAFHFTTFLFVIIALWRWQAHARNSLWKWVPRSVLLIGLSLGAYEAWHMHAFIGAQVLDKKNLLNEELLPQDIRAMVGHARASRAVALINLPYFHNGAEELMIPVDEEGLLLGQVVAYHSGIPMASSSLTRTGLEEVRWNIRAFGPTWYERPKLERWKATDTLLVLVAHALDDPYDKAILARTVELVEIGTHRMGRIAVADLLRDDRARLRSAWSAAMDTLSAQDAWTTDRPGSHFHHNTFDGLPGPHVMRGAGAFSGLKRDFNVLARIAPNTLDTGRSYIASFWYFDRGPMRCHSFIGIDEKDPLTGEGWWDHYTDARFSRTIVGDWSLIELPFTLRDPAHELQLFITGQPYYPDSIHVDELWIRAADADVYRRDPDGRIWKNGHFIDP